MVRDISKAFAMNMFYKRTDMGWTQEDIAKAVGPGAPGGITGTAPTTYGASDGKINGTAFAWNGDAGVIDDLIFLEASDANDFNSIMITIPTNVKMDINQDVAVESLLKKSAVMIGMIDGTLYCAVAIVVPNSNSTIAIII